MFRLKSTGGIWGFLNNKGGVGERREGRRLHRSFARERIEFEFEFIFILQRLQIRQDASFHLAVNTEL